MNTADQYISTLKPHLQEIVATIRKDIKKHSPVQEIMLRNVLMYRFPNGWIYINCHKRNYVMLGFGKGNKMIKQNPMLKLIFDEIKTVVAKIRIPDIETYHEKNIGTLIDLCRK